MQLTAFDHVNIKTANLDAMVQWYDDVLGMKSGKRPNFPFGGAWLYLGDQAIVHLVGVEEDPKSIDPKIEHFAVRATGLQDFLALLSARGIEPQISEIADFGILQVNVFDPDGNHIHVDFDLSEKA